MITLKIGRHSYDIYESDRFMDNGSIVQLLTQSKEKPDWGKRPSPVLSKRAIKEITALERVDKKYLNGVEVFGLRAS